MIKKHFCAKLARNCVFYEGAASILQQVKATISLLFACFLVGQATLPLRAEIQDDRLKGDIKDITFLSHSLSGAVYLGDDGLMHGRPHAGRRSFYVEVVMAMLAELGTTTLIEEVSLNRGLSLIDMQPNYAFFNLIRNAERKEKYKWVGPIAVFPTFFYDLAARPTHILNIEEAKAVNGICVLTGNNVVALLERLGFTNLIEAPSNETCGRMLQYGRVELITGSGNPWFTSDPELTTLFQRTAVTLSVDEGYIALSKAVPDRVIKALQGALDTLKQDGRYETIRRTFLIREQQPNVQDEPVQMRGRRRSTRPND
jgi:polar amino acid transport system substrate-binding protein